MRTPGCFRTYSINSVTVLTRTLGSTTRAEWFHEVARTGAKLFSLQRRYAYMRGFAMVDGPRKVQVYPSGVARETSSQARLPLAAGFASIMIGWRQISESLSVTMRVATSPFPPAGY